ncbi:MAG: LmbZ [Chthoniobacterales bacterium]|nr:MAG: LmbZ [Chthoniobacterales bacterium]
MFARETRFALIGCGLIGRKRVTSLRHGQLAVVCDRDTARANQLLETARSGRAINEVEEAIRDAEVDAVIVATPNSFLAPIAKLAIAAGKHVLIEKPAAISSSQITELLQLSASSSSCVRVGYNHRYHRAMQKAYELVRQGSAGPLMFLRARYGHGGRLGYEREWRADPAISGGGELIDQGVHLIDLASWFMGAEFTEVQGHTKTYFWDMPVEDNSFLSLQTAAGQMAWLHASCTEWKNMFSFEIYGRTGKLHIEGLGGSYGMERLTFYQMLPEMGPPKVLSWEFPGEDVSWKLEMDEFLQDIRQSRVPVPGLQEALHTLGIVEKVYQQTGRSI